MQLEPQEEFVLARGLENHLDSTTYYVRAVIRNAKTDALIATVDLTDQGDGLRFSKTWQVPGDPTGQGTYILITYSVYTDSGYTTKSENYGDKYEEHLILHRPSNMYGGSGADVDYKRITKLVREIIKEEGNSRPVYQPEPLNIPFHLQPVLNALTGVRRDIQAIDIPEAQATDIQPVLARIDALETALRTALKAKETDLSPVLNAIEAVDTKRGITATADTKEVTKRVNALSAQIQTALAELKTLKLVIDMPSQSLPVKVKDKEPEAEPIDYDELLKE